MGKGDQHLDFNKKIYTIIIQVVLMVGIKCNKLGIEGYTLKTINIVSDRHNFI